MFLATYESTVDVKKRVSIPASFRRVLDGEDTVYLWPSMDEPCIEGCGQALLNGFERSISELDLWDPRRNALAITILGETRPAKFDEGGRIVLDSELLAAAGISERACFVGMGDRFQIWEPSTFAAKKAAIRALAKESRELLKAVPPAPVRRVGFE